MFDESVKKRLPYFFTYKPSPLKLKIFQQTCVVQKKRKKEKRQTISYKPKAKFLIVTSHLSEQTSWKTLGNDSLTTKANELK